MNQFNALHSDEPNEPPRECNSQSPAYYFKWRTSPSKTNPVFSAITERLNNHAIDNGDVKDPTSYSPVDYNSESVLDPDTTTIKSIDDDEMHHLLEFFHSKHDKYLLDVYLQTIQY